MVQPAATHSINLKGQPNKSLSTGYFLVNFKGNTPPSSENGLKAPGSGFYRTQCSRIGSLATPRTFYIVLALVLPLSFHY